MGVGVIVRVRVRVGGRVRVRVRVVGKGVSLGKRVMPCPALRRSMHELGTQGLKGSFGSEGSQALNRAEGTHDATAALSAGRVREGLVEGVTAFAQLAGCEPGCGVGSSVGLVDGRGLVLARRVCVVPNCCGRVFARTSTGQRALASVHVGISPRCVRIHPVSVLRRHAVERDDVEIVEERTAPRQARNGLIGREGSE